MIRLVYLLLFSLFASNVYSQIQTFKVLGYSMYNLMNDNKWTEYTPEKDLLYVYYDLDNQEIQIYDTTTDTSNIYKCWEKADPFIKDKEGSYSIKATEVIGDLVLHELIQFVFNDDSIQLYITFGNTITMWELELLNKRSSSTNNYLNKQNKKDKNNILKKNPNFELE
jgi:hypothetical protein